MQAIRSKKRNLIDVVIDLLPSIPANKINKNTLWMTEDELQQLIEVIHEGKRNEFYEMLNS